tara:strand:+ start:12628 stop:13389 length:762 start_codon:yes stop_codon:yes gene_type:complete
MRKLKDKYKVEHIEAGHTPDGYSINERIQLEEKDSHNHVEIYKGGGAASFVIGFEDNQDKKAYQDMGVDTDSKEFKTFEAGLKDNENFNSKYVKDFLENAPELTVEKRQEIDKQRDIDLQKEKTAANEYNAKGGFIAEMSEKNNSPEALAVAAKEKEYSEDGKTEVAKPGRTYTGKVIEVGEDVTIQKTKSGKFVIHETENLPGIKEQDSNISAKIIYDAGGKGDITAKSNDLAIGKEKEIEQKKSHEKTMER